MEHLHWINGKAPKDTTYESNTKDLFLKDKNAYSAYLRNDFALDIARLKTNLGI
jgi:hypothetical protein